jgi:hypothetical protein
MNKYIIQLVYATERQGKTKSVGDEKNTSYQDLRGLKKNHQENKKL